MKRIFILLLIKKRYCIFFCLYHIYYILRRFKRHSSVLFFLWFDHWLWLQILFQNSWSFRVRSLSCLRRLFCCWKSFSGNWIKVFLHILDLRVFHKIFNPNWCLKCLDMLLMRRFCCWRFPFLNCWWLDLSFTIGLISEFQLR